MTSPFRQCRQYFFKGRKWRGAFRLIQIYETAYPTLFRDIQWDSEMPVKVLTAKFCNKLLESGKITWMIIFSIVLFCAQFDELSRKDCAKLFANDGLNSVCSMIKFLCFSYGSKSCRSFRFFQFCLEI